MKPTKHNVNELYARAYHHHSKGDLGMAMKKYLEIIQYFPAHLGCLHNVARLHMATNNTHEARDYLTRIIGINRQDHEAFLYRADCLRIEHACELALADCHASIEIRDTALAHNTLALIYRDQGQFDRAHDEWEQCLVLAPDDRARWAVNMGQSLLTQRDYDRGFKLYEGRRHAGIMQVRSQVRDHEPWLGQTPCANRRIIMHSEQGVGDTIQMLRYARVFKDQGAAWVGVVVQPELALLAQGVPGVDQVVAEEATWPLWDLHLSLMSAPRAARTLFQTIPWQGAYIPSTPTSLDTRPASIGFVWSGAQRVFHEEMWMRPPRSRDIPQAQMLSFIQDIHARWPDIRLVSLQAGRPVPEVPGLEQPSLTDWVATRDIVDSLDLVITVDTAVAHLAGAMARPVWLLNRKATDWRWHLDLATSPWYPSMQIFRQTAFNDWQPVLDQVLAQLETLNRG